jgi:hypothetical protein
MGTKKHSPVPSAWLIFLRFAKNLPGVNADGRHWLIRNSIGH